MKFKISYLNLVIKYKVVLNVLLFLEIIDNLYVKIKFHVVYDVHSMNFQLIYDLDENYLMLSINLRNQLLNFLLFQVYQLSFPMNLKRKNLQNKKKNFSFTHR